MANKVKPIPEGYHSLTPYLIINGAEKAIEFYKKAFGAKEKMRMAGSDKKIMHAELMIGDSVFMLSDACPERNMHSPQELKGSPVGLHLYVEDVDAFFQKAIASGATVIQPIMDQFYGDRSGMLQDPFGHIWSIATHKEDVSESEMQKRFEKIMPQQKQNKKCCG